jgi:hypothetical protein
MPYSVFITPTATDDISVAIEYYTSFLQILGIDSRIKLQIILIASLHCLQPLQFDIKMFGASR